MFIIYYVPEIKNKVKLKSIQARRDNIKKGTLYQITSHTLLIQTGLFNCRQNLRPGDQFMAENTDLYDGSKRIDLSAIYDKEYRFPLQLKSYNSNIIIPLPSINILNNENGHVELDEFKKMFSIPSVNLISTINEETYFKDQSFTPKKKIEGD